MKYQSGDTVGPYRVTGVIGEGATGVVYQVVNSVTGRLEAMKILADTLTHDLDQAQRFLREIQLQAKLDHPNIAQVRTAFCEGATIVLVMELVAGESLGSILQRGSLTVDGAIRVAEQVLNALIMAHHHGVVHRDVKPANILVDRQGVVKLTDFGLAKQYGDPGQTAQGLAVGTVFYMAPEQVRGLAATDWRADLYAVGVLLYEMLTGRKPFDGTEQYAIMRQQIELVPAPVSHWAPHVPKEYDALIARALQKDPAKRFQSASGFLAALQELPLSAPKPRRERWQYATYAAGLASLLLAAFAVPPVWWEPELETISISMPATPEVPAGAWQVQPTLSQPPAPSPVRASVVPAAAAAPAPPPRQEPAQTPPRKHAPFPATRVQRAETVASIDPPATKGAPAEAQPHTLPSSPKIVIAEPAPDEQVPAVAAPALPAEKPANWMRRGLGRVPKLFRRKEPQNTQSSQKP
ncbi:MAG: serine/threonine protein kinase [Acidobacteria bacterium]|nr:serine/threonine protein kinase [Acidobacteriota bacterium]